jgi:lipoprotein-anchoring transpeptidase ErfK/SrfK
MRFMLKTFVPASVLAMALSACVPETTQMAAPAPAPVMTPAEQPNAAHYASFVDGAFAIPAVPVEKVPAAYQRQDVAFDSAEAPGTIIINPAQRHLYLITGKGTATQYGISVGKAGFEWSGVATITGRRNWPTWTPPKEMIARKPELAKWEKGQPGGPSNPLGARALYLTTNGVDYGYRIHGTPDWWSIGKNASSGCIRMINQDVMELFNRVPDGTKVVVLNADGSYPSKLKLPPKPATKAKATPMATPKPATTESDAIEVTPLIVPKPSVMPAPVITTGAVAPAPVVAPVEAPAAAPAAPVCALPLVNGICPAN